MTLFELTSDGIHPLNETSFAQAGVKERNDLQKFLRDKIDVVSPETLVIAEEFSEWEDSRRRIDLLAIDKDANLVVIELKRTEDGGRMELQAIRYAALVYAMEFDRAVDVFHFLFQQSMIREIETHKSPFDKEGGSRAGLNYKNHLRTDATRDFFSSIGYSRTIGGIAFGRSEG